MRPKALPTGLADLLLSIHRNQGQVSGPIRGGGYDDPNGETFSGSLFLFAPTDELVVDQLVRRSLPRVPQCSARQMS